MPDSSPSLPLWLRARYRIEHALLRGAEWIVPRLSLRTAHAIADGLGWLMAKLDRRGRRVILENLRVALGDAITPEDRLVTVRENYRNFARTFVELFWSRRLADEPWDRHFVLTCDTPEARRVFDEGACIFATAHFGNFEWLSQGRALRGTPSMIIAQDMKNPPLTEIFRRLRGQGGQMIIPQAGAMLRLFKHLKKGGSAAALVDLNVHPDQSATIIRCFGLLTSVSVLHAALALRTGRPLMPALAIPLPDGRRELRFFDPVPVGPDDTLQSIAQRCWDIFEPVFRAHPAHWMWLYKHWRYLPEDAVPARYPAYANRSKKFDRLRRSHGG